MLILALLLQAAAPPFEVELNEGDIHQMSMIAGTRQVAAIEQVKMLKPAQLAVALNDALNDRTRIIYYDGLGVLVEYTAPGGELRLWYPGQRSAVVGQWGVQQKKKLVNACFRYRAATSPVPQPFEPQQCVRPEQTLGETNVIREWRGDVFNLMTGRIPYVKSVMGLPTP
jgi:hypothetical protein